MLITAILASFLAIQNGASEKLKTRKNQNCERGDRAESDDDKRRSFSSAGAGVLTFFTAVEMSAIFKTQFKRRTRYYGENSY